MFGGRFGVQGSTNCLRAAQAIPNCGLANVPALVRF